MKYTLNWEWTKKQNTLIEVILAGDNKKIQVFTLTARRKEIWKLCFTWNVMEMFNYKIKELNDDKTVKSAKGNFYSLVCDENFDYRKLLLYLSGILYVWNISLVIFSQSCICLKRSAVNLTESSKALASIARSNKHSG